MDKTQPKDWSKEWLDCVDPQKVTRYPLQLANCDRLEKNNAVYIFDEVGAGKTIMAGLMALHYSYHCYQADGRKARILVITTNQLADRDGEPGPFKQMWLDKLPFYEHWAGHVKVINHDYRNIRKVNGREQWNLDQVGDNWDLVIIDEAHVFLEHDNKRYKELVNGEKGGKILAKKVVFLTATPIKGKLSDLNTYSHLARLMTHSQGPNTNKSAYVCFDNVESSGASAVLAPGVKSEPISQKDLVCAAFDPSLPFTRYFKDTFRALPPVDKKDSSTQGEDPSTQEKKSVPVRRLAKVWKCSQESRQETVLENINRMYEEAPGKNRFVIFVRWVKKNHIDVGCSAEELEAYFIAHGFSKWEAGCEGKSVEVVTGANRKSLRDYCSPDPGVVPTVLIVNYQIGEQGVNLPGYNHVINYHIPASPSALEQRFGRIDRLDSKSDEIHVYYPLLDGYWDSNTVNFYIAVSTYLKQFLPVLPSRNSLLTEEILDTFKEDKSKMQELVHKIEDIRTQWKSDAPWGNVLQYLDRANSYGVAEDDSLTQEELEVARFISGAKGMAYRDGSEADRIKRLKDNCIKRCEFFSKYRVSNKEIESAKETVRKIGNQIFYCLNRVGTDTPREEIIKNLEKIDPGADGCAGIIRNSASYQEYVKSLKKFKTDNT